MSLQGLITTKLDRKKLDQEKTFIQHVDSADILLNGVNHIYARLSASREREPSSNNDKVPEGINDVIDEMMEYEPEFLVPTSTIYRCRHLQHLLLPILENRPRGCDLHHRTDEYARTYQFCATIR